MAGLLDLLGLGSQFGGGTGGLLDGLRGQQGMLGGVGAGLLSGTDWRTGLANGIIAGQQGKSRDKVTADEATRKAAYAKYAATGKLSPEAAAALAADPELARTYAAAQLSPKAGPQLGVTGEGRDGSKTYGWIDSQNQSVTPYTPPGGAGVGGVADLFQGKSPEADALNEAVRTGRMTREQAANFAGGKVVTFPDGSSKFMRMDELAGLSSAQTGQPSAGLPSPLAGTPAAPAGSAAPMAAPAPGASAAPPLPTAGATPGMAAPASTGPGVQLSPAKVGGGKTEDQAKQQQLYHDMQNDLPIVAKNWSALSNLADQAGGSVPFVGNWLTSPEYQQANVALKRIIYNDVFSKSGASTPDAQLEAMSKQLMPQPGESSETVKQKWGAIQSALEGVAIRGGLTPDQRGAPLTPGGGAASAVKILSVDGVPQ